MYINSLNVVCAISKLVHISSPSTGAITYYYDCLLDIQLAIDYPTTTIYWSGDPSLTVCETCLRF